MDLPRQLPPNLHQSVARLAAAAGIHLQPPSHWQTDTRNMFPVMISHLQLPAWRFSGGYFWAYLPDLPWIWGSLPAASERAGETVKMVNVKLKYLLWLSWAQTLCSSMKPKFGIKFKFFGGKLNEIPLQDLLWSSKHKEWKKNYKCVLNISHFTPKTCKR